MAATDKASSETEVSLAIATTSAAEEVRESQQASEAPLDSLDPGAGLPRVFPVRPRSSILVAMPVDTIHDAMRRPSPPSPPVTATVAPVTATANPDRGSEEGLVGCAVTTTFPACDACARALRAEDVEARLYRRR
jgi:hypothetical protein